MHPSISQIEEHFAAIEEANSHLQLRSGLFPSLGDISRNLDTAIQTFRHEIILPYLIQDVFKESSTESRYKPLSSLNKYLCPFYNVPIDEKSWLVLNLAMALDYRDINIRQLAQKCLALLEQVELVPKLLDLLNNPHEDRYIREESASILGHIARPADLILPSLLKVLKNTQEYETLRSRCAVALANFTHHREMVVPELENLLTTEENEWVREDGLLKALAEIRTQ